MGSIGTLIAATLVAVTYGWMPASSGDNGKSSVDAGYEYLVQIDAEDLRALADGRVSSLSSATPEGMKSIDRVRIVFGKGDLPRQLTAIDRTSPKRLSKLSQTAVKHTVAKPMVSDWLPARSEESKEESGQRHKVYQSPGYQNPGSLGETMQQRSQQLSDAIRSAPEDFSDYMNQAGRDFSRGTQDVVNGAMGGSQSNGAATGTGPSYTPYNYEQQPTAGQANNQNNRTGSNTGLYQQPVDNRTQGPALPPPPATDNGIATTFGSGATNNDPSYRRNETNPNYAPSNNDFQRNNNSNTGTFNNSQQFGERRDEGRLTAVARESTPLAPLDEFSNRREETYPEPPQSQYDAWRTPTVDNRPASTNAGTRDPWGVPPLTSQPLVTQTADSRGSNSNQGPLPEAQSRGYGSNNGNASNYNQGNSQNNGFANNGANNNNNNNQQNASLDNPWLMVFLLGSLAGNVYVATSYLDVRNKYRSALRRGPSGYQHGV